MDTLLTYLPAIIAFVVGLALSYFILSKASKDLQTQLDAAGGQLGEAQAAVEAAQKETAAEKQKVEDAKAEVASVNEFVGQLESHIDRMEVREANLKEEFSALEDTYNQELKNSKEAKAEIAALKGEISVIKKLNDSKTQKVAVQKARDEAAKKVRDEDKAEEKKPESKGPSQLTQRVSIKAPARKDGEKKGGAPSQLTQRVSLKAPARKDGEGNTISKNTQRVSLKAPAKGDGKSVSKDTTPVRPPKPE